ncbi:MAG: chromate transporter [Lachnospiraceae bacterium]|nr:chromate transporter [Lachnospiraceae bacterium]
MKKAGLAELFISFAKVGVMTFGGGYAMLPILQREIVENKGWATDEDLANYFAIGQCTPGVIAVNTATFIGYKTRGKIGGIAATLGVVFPSVLIITTLAGVISAFADNIYVAKAFNGIRACVCVLILKAILKLWKSAVNTKLTMTVFLIGLALALFTEIPLVALIFIDIAFGIIFAAINKKDSKEVKS